MQKIRAACDDAGCALIFDEVMTSRLAPGGAQELLGVTPDLTTFGKYYGGGLPFGGFGGTRHWMERHDPTHPKSINSGGLLIKTPSALLQLRRSLHIFGQRNNVYSTTNARLSLSKPSTSLRAAITHPAKPMEAAVC